METKVTSPLAKAVIIALILIVFNLIIQFMNMLDNKGVGSIGIVILIAGIIWSVVTYAKQLSGNVTFGNAFAHGFKVTAAITAIMIIYTFISLKFINPEMRDIAMEKARAQLESQGQSDEQIDKILNMTKKNFVLFAVAGQLLSTIIIGAIASLIGAAVAKKNPQGPFVQQG